MRTRARGNLPRRGVAGLGAAAVLAVAGCGGSSDGAEGDSGAAGAASTTLVSEAAGKAKGPSIKVMRTDYGPILVTGRGRALYLFTSDGGRQSNCYDDCAVAWPPYIVKSKPRAGEGAKAGKIGTTRRSDGRLQATYAGHPLYFYEGDREPGQVLCQAVNEFGGFWYVLRASGKAVT
jgi:predicted lipoprotein with Yx(FWY)xxD motif